MKASEIFTPETKKKTLYILKLFNGKVVKVEETKKGDESKYRPSLEKEQPEERRSREKSG